MDSSASVNAETSRLAVFAGSLVMAVILGGCQSQVSRIAAITTVEVVEPVTIPSNRARAVFHQGQQVDGAYPYDLYCELEVSSVSPLPQRIDKDLFVVGRTGSAFLSAADSRLPIGGPFVEVNCGDLIFYEVEYRLASDIQPGVRKIRCLQGFNACEEGVVPPTIESIADTLGPSFILSGDGSVPVR